MVLEKEVHVINIFKLVILLLISSLSFTNCGDNSYRNQVDDWHKGGTLHNASVGGWEMAIDKNKLATCGDFMAAFDSSVSMEVLKYRAEELKTCIDYSIAKGYFTNNDRISTIAANCIQNENIISKIEGSPKSKKSGEVFKQFSSLYNELIEFKNNSDFKKYGFGKGGPYNKWLTKVQALKNNPDSELLLDYGVIISELELLGMEYVSSNGQETYVTKTFNEIFRDAINSNTNTEINNTDKPIQIEQPKIEDTLSETEKTENAFKEFSYLYSELDDFKDNPSFKANGFSQTFRKWLKNIEIFRNDPNSRLLIAKGLKVDDLQNLGIAYEGSKGNETKVTRNLNKTILEAIPSSYRPVYGENNYRKLKTDYKNIEGKWIIKIVMFNNSGYAFEIYKRENDYVGILPQASFRQMILKKNGNSFSVVGDKYEDYKIITREEFDLKG